MIKSTFILFLVSCCFSAASGQGVLQESDEPGFPQNSIPGTQDSGRHVIFLSRGNCKRVLTETVFFKATETATIKTIPSKILPPAKQSFLSVHGNVTYNFNYRSYIDTPFAEQDLMQHSIQTRMNFKVKDQYPFTVFLTSRRSNSDYFSNATDVSVQFRQTDMLEDIKRKMQKNADILLQDELFRVTPAQLYEREIAAIAKGRMPDILKAAAQQGEVMLIEKRKAAEDKMKKLYAEYKAKADALKKLQTKNVYSAGHQKETEDKEKKLRDRAQSLKDSLTNAAKTYAGQKMPKYAQNADSLNKALIRKAEEKKKAIDSLKNEISKAETAIKSFQKKVTDSLLEIKKKIAAIKDRDGLYDYIQKQGESTLQLSRLQRSLLAVKQVGIGRTWLDYSELTVKNISLNGINIEMNPGNIYLAAAAGKVNYRFRDYIIKGSTAGRGQSLGLIRAGFGRKDRNNVIVTYYAGKKALLNQRSSADSSAVQNIAGVSVESRFAIDGNNFLIGEYARSVSPNINGKIFDLKTHTNEAWSLKLFSNYGNTKISSYYRKTGEGFQSFTLYPSNNKQDAWMVRVNQSFWKKRFVVDGAIRKNDFESAIAAPDFRNTNVFKSLQLTARVPKYPFLSLGYYPSSQLTLSNNNVLFENRYNTLNGIISHSYFLGRLNMNSNAIYTKFFNAGSDTGFVYYNAVTMTVTHSVNLKSFTLQGMLTETKQAILRQTTVEPLVTYTLKNKLSITGSVKWSRVNHAETLWGGTAGLNLYLKKFGVIQVKYDKIFLPGYNRSLLPVDMGRLTYSRAF